MVVVAAAAGHCGGGRSRVGWCRMRNERPASGAARSGHYIVRVSYPSLLSGAQLRLLFGASPLARRNPPSLTRHARCPDLWRRHGEETVTDHRGQLNPSQPSGLSCRVGHSITIADVIRR